MSEIEELPKGWMKTTVKDVSLSIQYGYTESSTIENIGPKFLRITDIQENKVCWQNVPYCKISEAEIERYLLHDGDLVFARTGATVGKSFLIKGVIPKAIFASYLLRLRFPEQIFDKFISYYFQSPFYWNEILKKQVGTGQPNVNGTVLGILQFPLPPSQNNTASSPKQKNSSAAWIKASRVLRPRRHNLKPIARRCSNGLLKGS